MNHDEITPAAPATIADPASRSMWTNFKDVILEPSATFEDVGRRPKWVGPLVVIMVATLVTSFLLMPLWLELQRLGAIRQDIPAERREQAMQMMETFKWVGLALAPIMAGIFTAVFALFFWAWGAISGGKNASFKIAFSSLLYAGIIIVIQSVAQWVVMLVKGAEQVALEGGMPTFGLALFVERGDMNRFLWGFVQSVNFFSIWQAVVVAIAGIYALRMTKGSATTFAIAMWLLGIVLFAFQG